MGRRFRIKYAGPVTPIPANLNTLGDFLGDPKHQLHICCNDCGCHQVLNIPDVAATYGKRFPVHAIAERLRCTRCRPKWRGPGNCTLYYGHGLPLPVPWYGNNQPYDLR